MPLIRISIINGKTKEHKKAILDGVHDALVSAFKIPENDRIQILEEHDRENFEIMEKHLDSFTLVEITAFKGRSYEAKKLLYQTIVENLKKNPGIRPEDVFIILQDPEKENWGIRGGQIASEVDFGFRVDV